MMSEIEEKTPRYVFSGKTEDYLTWSKKYMARATMKKFAGVIKGTKKLRTKSEIENETDGAKKKEAAQTAASTNYTLQSVSHDKVPRVCNNVLQANWYVRYVLLKMHS